MSALPHLVCLQLRRCGRISDSGLAFIASGQAPIKALDISNCHSITSSGIRVLSGLRTLETLVVVGCTRATTVLGFAALSSFSTALKCLDASHNPRIDDGCLNALSFASQLRRISLRSCPRVTDNGLLALARIHRLERLGVDECRGVTYHGVMKLKSKLPLLRGAILVSPLNCKGGIMGAYNMHNNYHSIPQYNPDINGQTNENGSNIGGDGFRGSGGPAPGSPVVAFPVESDNMD